MPLFKTHCFLFFLLTVATLVSHARFEQYVQIGPQLQTADWNFRTTESNRVEITENGLNLSSSKAGTVVSVHQFLPAVKPGTVLLVSADMQCANVIAGTHSWNSARLLLAQNDGKKDRWDLSHTVIALTGTHEWKNYRKAFIIAPETQSIRLLAQLSQATGSLQIRNIQVYPVYENPDYRSARTIILFAWGAYFLLLLGSFLLMHKKNILVHLLLVFAFISIIAGTTLPGDMKNQVSNEVKIQIDADSESFKTAIPWDLSKIWHLCFFFLFGAILCVTMRKEPILQTVTIILMLAASTEFAQLYIEGRTALLGDFFIDAAGGVVGVILSGIFISKPKTVYTENKTAQQKFQDWE